MSPRCLFLPRGRGRSSPAWALQANRFEFGISLGGETIAESESERVTSFERFERAQKADARRTAVAAPPGKGNDFRCCPQGDSPGVAVARDRESAARQIAASAAQQLRRLTRTPWLRAVSAAVAIGLVAFVTGVALGLAWGSGSTAWTVAAADAAVRWVAAAAGRRRSRIGTPRCGRTR